VNNLATESIADIDKYELLATELNSTTVAKLGLTGGNNFKSLMISMTPGQEVPIHSHAGHSVLLIPQTGTGTLFSASTNPTSLSTGCLYVDHKGSAFGLKNDSPEPFRVLVILVSSKQIANP
jgi:quercetin dioxygenase-like cupin family protein